MFTAVNMMFTAVNKDRFTAVNMLFTAVNMMSPVWFPEQCAAGSQGGGNPVPRRVRFRKI